jgi:hypothetical protein
MGFDMAKVGFIRWLVDNGYDPEWRVRRPVWRKVSRQQAAPVSAPSEAPA